MKISAADWHDSQKYEREYWQVQSEKGNLEQYHRWGWYRNVCFPYWLPGRSFEGLELIDVGSGPEGILHYVGNAALKVAADPLMDEYIKAGFEVRANGVIPIAVAGEDLGPSKCYDVAFCLNCLDHCRDPARVVQNLYEILRIGGTLVLCVDMRHPEDADKLHKIVIDEEWISGTVKAAGFTIERFELVPHQAPTRTVQYCAILKKGAAE